MCECSLSGLNANSRYIRRKRRKSKERGKRGYKCACQQKNADWMRSRQKPIINSVTSRWSTRQLLFALPLPLYPLDIVSFSLSFAFFHLYILSNLSFATASIAASPGVFSPQKIFALHRNKREGGRIFFLIIRNRT